jgi:hypothetical protein
LLKFFLNICSTPQKHPAATVAVSAPAGTPIGAAGAELIEKDRTNRDKKDIEMYDKRIRQTKVNGFSLAVWKLFGVVELAENEDSRCFM